MNVGFGREFNSESEQLAADRRARVAAAVSQQEWLDKEEIKWIPQKYRNSIKHGDGDTGYELDEEAFLEDTNVSQMEGNMDYLLGPEPEETPEEQNKAIIKKYMYHLAVLMFAVILLGSVYFFWDQMHTNVDPHRPILNEMKQVEGDGISVGGLGGSS